MIATSWFFNKNVKEKNHIPAMRVFTGRLFATLITDWSNAAYIVFLV